MAIIFSKILTKTDVEKRLSFPMKGLRSLPSFGLGRRCAVEFQAVDGNGHPWRFGCSILRSLPSFGLGRRCAVEFQAVDGNGHPWRFGCSIRRKGHPKPVLSKGWLAFVAHNKLQIGDEVKFYQEGVTTGASQYTIKVKKAVVKLFGVDIGSGPIASDHLKGSPKFYKFM